jgi:uncharacterized damage-inducible protein DinB
MNSHPYSKLVRYKQWADHGLHEIVAKDLGQLEAQDAAIIVGLLDHIQVVDRIFQHHLRGLPHAFHAPRSEVTRDIRTLTEDARQVNDWYASYVGGLSPLDFETPVDFVFTNGEPARMTRGEIILHVCLHGTYHRGNAGIVLRKHGIAPNNDRMTDFLEATA